MRCTFCGAPLPKQGLNCDYCNRLNPLNKRLLNTQKSESSNSNYLCPICEVTLEHLEEKEFSLDYCPKCDGLLIQEKEFENLLSYRADKTRNFNPHYLRFIQDHPRDNRKKAQYHNCPVCREMMSIVNYKNQSGILLDICEEDGIWLDGGELRQIIEWYEVGGDKKIFYSR